MEWPRGETEPRKHWISNLAKNLQLRDLVHFEGRGWRGFHHRATLCIAAYGFLVAERSCIPPLAHSGHLGLPTPQLPPGFQPRESSLSAAA
jgi:SRSO17 transposase